MSAIVANAGDIFTADVDLSWFEAFASNDTIASKFASAGFVEVTCTGSGSERHVQGQWPGPTTTLDSSQLDPHLTDIRKVAGLV